MSTPELHLQTSFVLNTECRILSTREPGGVRGPRFVLIRGSTSCAWAFRADVSADAVHELDRLAREEPPARDLREPPVYAQRYLDVLADRVASGASVASKTRQSDGPAFSFPASLEEVADVAVVESEAPLEHNFRGWIPGEIEAGRSPVLAVFEDGYPVSVCFCARRSAAAAEAGLETAEQYRRRGFGARVTAAWARAIRSSGRVPLYSTSWTNEASLAVARKLSLSAYASSWSVAD